MAFGQADWLTKAAQAEIGPLDAALEREAFHRVSGYVRELLWHLAEQHLYDGDPGRIELIAWLSDYHDIGKVYVPREILFEPGPLNRNGKEWELMKRHAVWGKEIMERIGSYVKDPSLVALAAQICLYHHERYDGTGYPFGLKGQEIPLEIQAVGMADAYAALRSDRCYKRAISHKEAVAMICEGKCGGFSKSMYAALEQMTGQRYLNTF